MEAQHQTRGGSWLGGQGSTAAVHSEAGRGPGPASGSASSEECEPQGHELDDAEHTLLRPHVVSFGDDYQGETLPPDWFSWRKLWAFTGPGFLMSIAYIVRPVLQHACP